MFGEILILLTYSMIISTYVPELDVKQGGIREVRQTLNVEDLLNLGSPLHQWFNWFGLNVEL